MSKYKTIQTEFRNLESLKKALSDFGYDLSKIEIARNPKVNDLPMIGYLNDVRPELAAIRIPKALVGSASNDLGFAWNGKAYTMIVSDYDSHTHMTEAHQNKIAQRYAYHEVVRSAKAKGYTIQQTTQQDGTIIMNLVRR